MTLWIILALLLILLIVILGKYFHRTEKRKKLFQIRKLWGTQNNANRNFKLISSYLNLKSAGSSSLAVDLDLDDLFCFVDRTNSKPGQQVLYKRLHSHEETQSLNQLEELITKFDKDPVLRELTQLKLADLNKDDALFLPELFSKEQQPIFNTFTTYYIKIGLPALAALVVAFFYRAQSDILSSHFSMPHC